MSDDRRQGIACYFPGILLDTSFHHHIMQRALFSAELVIYQWRPICSSHNGDILNRGSEKESQKEAMEQGNEEREAEDEYSATNTTAPTKPKPAPHLTIA